MSENRFIEHFKINIGQQSIGGAPVGEVFMQVEINDRFCMFLLNDLKKCIDAIAESNGDRSAKAYKAKNNLDEIFKTMLFPWMKIRPCKKAE